MLFNSTLFLFFLPAVVVIYYRLPQRERQVFILLASYAFYWVWSVKWSVLLLITTVVDYSIAKWLDREQRDAHRRWIVAVSMACNLALLGVFKYADFLSNSVFDLTQRWLESGGVRPWPLLDVVLPPGISFYTFMSMAYVIDVYRRKLKARDSILDFALFVSYFPHLVAGPILRAKELLPQLTTRQSLDWTNIRMGIAHILWGMMMKVYIADPMGRVVNEAYGATSACSGLGLLLATYAFAVQIYCDFAGYSAIAIGSALLLGVRLPENFRTPYMSLSIREFWRRWHISLSSWLRDYLYIPLGGNRHGTVRTYVNVMITMLLGGIWHGAGWHWMVWGGIQGIAMSLERMLGLREEHPRSVAFRLVRWFVTFHIVCLSWVFFRSHGIEHAAEVLWRIATLAPGEYFHGWRPLMFLALVLLLDLGAVQDRWIAFAATRPAFVRWLTYASVLVLFLTFKGATNQEFIYFQF